MPKRNARPIGCLGLVGALVVGLLAGGLAIQVGCPRPPDVLRAAAAAEQGAGAGGTRPEESTYLTFPEWYIVYAAREEASWLRDGPPSGFPYLGAVGQFWCGYAAVYDLTRTRYGFNVDDHLMLVVIGTSFTAENGARALYEGTVGRASEAIGGRNSQEDRFAARLAADYAAFMNETPWYEFPFGQRLGALWQLPTGGPSPLRAWERRFALSLQLGGKAVYGGAIRLAANVIYGPEVLATSISVARPDGGDMQLELPRYSAFQVPLLGLLRGGAELRTIAGNREILLSLLAPREWHYEGTEATRLFEQPLLTDPAHKRVALSAPVAALRRLVARLDAAGITIEHIYDY